MALIFNTLTKEKEEFKALQRKSVSIYQCGPTVYWTQHIGNMRAVFTGDIVYRTLQYLNYKVNFVRNYTDVGHLTGDNIGDANTGEDKMDKAAKRDGLSPQEIATKYIAQYDKDVKRLNALIPTSRPKATDYIYNIKKMVKTLLKKGFAYETNMGIYFDTSKAIDYTRLSRQKIEENKSGLGSGDISDIQKKNPNDFALWIYKKGMHENALQTWPSPKLSLFSKKTKGFPGWHIECSSMIKDFLGNTIDIHIGGIEHIPVHHTNEIAQSENANGKPFVNYWIHHEHLLVDNKKMAKSEGTAFSLDEIIEKGFSPLALRFFFLQAHYRSKQNFTWEALQAAENGLQKLKRDFSKLEGSEKTKEKPDSYFVNKFKGRISDDFNTPQALSTVYEVLDSSLSSKIKRATILNFDAILGLDLEKSKQKTNTKINIKTKTKTIPKEIIKLAEERQEARQNKDYAKSDELRNLINKKGYEIKDKNKDSKRKREIEEKDYEITLK